MRVEKLPDDLKELLELCQHGQLFAVQEWIASGKRVALAGCNFRNTPLIASIRCGFHSLVEVLLSAGVIHQEEKDRAMREAVAMRRLDLIELLADHGVDPKGVDFADEVLWTRVPSIIRWFIQRGADLETGYPIARAFQCRNRQFLGIYMDLRDEVPSARMQAAMALRYHCGQGNLKWVSLLMWAGTDPRLVVPDVEDPNLNVPGAELYEPCSSLAEAVRSGRTEVVQKIGLKPAVDDLSLLLCEASFSCKPEIFSLLVVAGADPSLGSGWDSPMGRLMASFTWSLESRWRTDDSGSVLACIELAAARGGRWRLEHMDGFRSLRRAISQAFTQSSCRAVSLLQQLVKTGVMEQETFAELMRTPRMREILESSTHGVEELRSFAGYSSRLSAKKRLRRKSKT